jgi:hypothetical protein
MVGAHCAGRFGAEHCGGTELAAAVARRWTLKTSPPDSAVFAPTFSAETHEERSVACEHGPLQGVDAPFSWVRAEFKGAEDLKYIVFRPPVFVPSLGHVELDCRDDLAIVRTYFASGELSEVRLHNVMVRLGDTCQVVQVESRVRG